MSYSFNVRGADRHEIDYLAGQQFDLIVASQPVHEIDRNQARTAVHGFTQMLGKPAEGYEISMAVAGSLSYTTEDDKTKVTAASISVSVAFVQKET